jgi:hypothetical protein
MDPEEYYIFKRKEKTKKITKQFLHLFNKSYPLKKLTHDHGNLDKINTNLEDIQDSFDSDTTKKLQENVDLTEAGKLEYLDFIEKVKNDERIRFDSLDINKNYKNHENENIFTILAKNYYDSLKEENNNGLENSLNNNSNKKDDHNNFYTTLDKEPGKLNTLTSDSFNNFNNLNLNNNNTINTIDMDNKNINSLELSQAVLSENIKNEVICNNNMSIFSSSKLLSLVKNNGSSLEFQGTSVSPITNHNIYNNLSYYQYIQPNNVIKEEENEDLMNTNKLDSKKSAKFNQQRKRTRSNIDGFQQVKSNFITNDKNKQKSENLKYLELSASSENSVTLTNIYGKKPNKESKGMHKPSKTAYNNHFFTNLLNISELEVGNKSIKENKDSMVYLNSYLEEEEESKINKLNQLNKLDKNKESFIKAKNLENKNKNEFLSKINATPISELENPIISSLENNTLLSNNQLVSCRTSSKKISSKLKLRKTKCYKRQSSELILNNNLKDFEVHDHEIFDKLDFITEITSKEKITGNDFDLTECFIKLKTEDFNTCVYTLVSIISSVLYHESCTYSTEGGISKELEHVKEKVQVFLLIICSFSNVLFSKCFFIIYKINIELVISTVLRYYLKVQVDKSQGTILSIGMYILYINNLKDNIFSINYRYSLMIETGLCLIHPNYFFHSKIKILLKNLFKNKIFLINFRY